MPDPRHPLVGRVIVRRGPRGRAEQGVITRVDEPNRVLYAQYGLGSISQATRVDERLEFVDGSLVAPALEANR